MLKKLRLFFIPLLLLTLPACSYTVVGKVTLDKYLEKSGVSAKAVSDESYDNITNSKNFIVYDIPKNVRVYDKRGGQSLEIFAALPNSNIADEVATVIKDGKEQKQITRYSEFEDAVFKAAYELRKQFKVDERNHNHLYLYYSDSWWMWDLTNLRLQWDMYESLPTLNNSDFFDFLLFG